MGDSEAVKCQNISAAVVIDGPSMTTSKSAAQITCSPLFNSSSCLSADSSNRSSPDSLLLRSAKSVRTPSTGNLLLTVPFERFGAGRRLPSQGSLKIPINANEALFEERSDLVLTCGALSSAVLGRIKSFSTSDLNLIPSDQLSFDNSPGIRMSASDVAVYQCDESIMSAGEAWNSRIGLPGIRNLDANSRSCSTWVIVGDRLSSVSQLPSPQTHSSAGTMSPVVPCPMDIVLTINKKARQAYIRKRLLSTYRLLERLSKSSHSLDAIVKGDLGTVSPSWSAFSGKSNQPGNASQNFSPPQSTASSSKGPCLSSTGMPISPVRVTNPSSSSSRNTDRLDLSILQNDLSSLTARDIEIQKGKPLSKYQRNMLIFNWLQDVD